MTQTLTQPKTLPPSSQMEKTAAKPSPVQPAAVAAKNLSPQDRQSQPKPRKIARPPTILRFSPSAWAKLLFLCDRGGTEVGGFGITPADDLLYVSDFLTVRQEATVASISLDDEAVADLFDRQVDGGLKPVQFCRLWLHTHPGNSPQPSSVDEETFGRVFGSCEHAVMFILAEGGQTYARLRFNVGPGGSMVIPVQVDYSRPFPASDQDAWEAEYRANIHPVANDFFGSGRVFDDWLNEAPRRERRQAVTKQGLCVPDEWMQELGRMEPAERQAILDELASRDDWWTEAGFHYDDEPEGGPDHGRD